jgi:hypothetical protein
MSTKRNTATAAGAGEGQVITRVHAPGIETLNTRELLAIQSLFAWIAAEQDTAPETVRVITETRFGAEDVSALPRKDYDEVIRFLVDLRIDEFCN